MKIHLINNQKKYKIETNNILKVIESLCQNLKQSKENWDEISIIIVDNNKIKKLHKKYFNKNFITDVIT
ncbi:MAG: rRNA maturation RNAse YbeY, partial [Verrucomicrobiota bacterium]|nr:rRNA maturation RNAse YbeY [Verrucomicrobiota bacterium]